MWCKVYRTGCGGAREGGGGEIRWENVRQEEGEIFFIIYLQCFPLKGWRPKRWKPIFMCGPVLYSMFCR